MFNLRRYFSLASAVAIAAVTVTLVGVYQRHSTDQLIESAEGENVTLARAFANMIWPRFSSYVMSISGADGDALRARSETQEIHDALSTLTSGLPVLKLKIYNLHGLTVYSSQPSQIGADKSNNLGYLKSARDGSPASKLSHRDTFSAFSGAVQDRDLVESYIPIWGPDGAIEGVFELYTDVTPLVARIEHTTIRLTIGLLLILGLLYGVLFLIVHHADRILKKQYFALLRSEEASKQAENALRAAHDTLEQRVSERTVALKRQSKSLTRLADDLLVARDEARAADRAKSEFLAAMSHELRTPLNAVIGFSEIMKTETLGPIGSVKYREYAEDIHESGQHLLGLIDDILDLSKIESGADEFHEDTIEIPEIIRSVLMLVGQRAEQEGIKIELELPDQLPALRADERKLKQILANLLSNAVKFTDAGGEVTLRAWCRMDSGYVFQIVDTGIGIAPEDIPKALSRFGQVDGDLNRQYEGTGLGLPLTKALVEQQGGILDLRSEVGVGTTVTVRFPAERIVASLDNSDTLDAEDGAAS